MKTTCEARKYCDKCFVGYYPKRNDHKCGTFICKNCGEKHDGSPHFCLIGVLDKERISKDDKVRKVFVSFDTETRGGETEDGYTEMIPNLIISQTVCDLCYNYEEQTKLADCDFCGSFTSEFFGEECSDRFVHYVCEVLAKKISDTESRIYVFAHNLSVSSHLIIKFLTQCLQGFDGRFIMQSLWKKNYKGLTLIQKGTKIVKVDVSNVRFLDSLAILQMSLAKTAKSFRDKKDRVKGDFPHLMNKPEFYDYNGSMPSKELYASKFFSKEKLNEFNTWYNKQVEDGVVFNFMEELKKYCTNDVEILLFSVLQFWKLFKDITTVDPFTRKFTLASIGQEYFRSCIMKPKTIGIVPLGGYVPKDSSVPESAWLDHIEKENGIQLIRQYRIGPYKVDGYHEDSRTVYEFLGMCNTICQHYDLTPC